MSEFFDNLNNPDGELPKSWPASFYKVGRLFIGLVAYLLTIAAVVFLILQFLA